MPETTHSPRPVVLIILDGWGLAPPGPGNAITLAHTPNISSYWAVYPHTQLIASGEAVGLPRGEPGNTETGHLNIGAGHIVYQDLLRLNMSIADGTFFTNSVLTDAVKHANQHQSNLHIMGLIGAGGVHSNMEHLFALLAFCKNQNFTRVFLHLFTDGRDSPPTGALSYIAQVRAAIAKDGIGQIASLMGRYYAMDRDLRWERTEKAYLALSQGAGETFATPEEAIQASYAQNITDEFIKPAVFANGTGKPITIIKENDAVIFFNFRIDRPRQLTKAFVLDNFEADANSSSYDPFAVKYFKKHDNGQLSGDRPLFKRGAKIGNLFFVTLTEYQKNLPVHVAFPPEVVDMPLGRVISERGLRQLRATESEKERFVTFFLNGQREVRFPGEDRFIVPSPNVATYDLKPEMSSKELTDGIVNHIKSGMYDFIAINFPNPDMVGHTGILSAGVKAVEATDSSVGKIVNAVLAFNGCVVISADHGNVEEMVNPRTGQTDTEHSSFPVPLIIIQQGLLGQKTLPSGILADIAPTILALMNVPKPPTMFGRNLLI